jgi:hypothetical protein
MGSGGEPLEALNSSLQVKCQFGDWAWRVVARRMARQASSVSLQRVKDGRPSDEAHISESRYGAPGLVAAVEEYGLASLDNPPFARNAKDGAPGLVEVPEFCGDTEVVLGGSMVIIVGATGEKARATV